MKNRLLFVLRHRDNRYSDEPYSYAGGLSSGLLNSARFVVEMLRENGVPAHLVQVRDNNDIDREIAKHKPTHVIIEAFWVVPEKFDVLKRLHPHVHFIVRNHSAVPFLAQEGRAVEWTIGYMKRGVVVAPNSIDMLEDTRTIARSIGVNTSLVQFLPNTYRLNHHLPPRHESPWFDVGCFGAIRPLKNQLMQAIAALRFADKHHLKLRLHINATRVEQGNNVLSNIRSLFAAQPRHRLVEHSWLSHDRFLKLMSKMDMALCVSFSETFCIVAADAVNMDVPLVTSAEVAWASTHSMALPTESGSIVAAMETAHADAHHGQIKRWNRALLVRTIESARERWLSTFKR